MKRKTRQLLLVLLSSVFLISAGVLLYELFQYQAGDDAYSEAETLVNLPLFPEAEPPAEDIPADTAVPSAEERTEGESDVEAGQPTYVDPYADALRNMDFTSLQAVNQDVLGWILIPGTKISYPVVRGSDNSYYLNRTWKKTASSVGAIFMDNRSSTDLSDFNTIIYGHRMNNGSMFAGLKYYKQQSYLKQHPIVYLTTAQGTYQYEIFSVYEGSPSGESYRTGIRNNATKQNFLDMAADASLYDTGLTPTVNDSVLTLSTCTGNGHAKRLIVHAIRRGYAASDEAEATAPSDTPAEGTETTADAAQPQEPVDHQPPAPEAEIGATPSAQADEITDGSSGVTQEPPPISADTPA